MRYLCGQLIIEFSVNAEKTEKWQQLCVDGKVTLPREGADPLVWEVSGLPIQREKKDANARNRQAAAQIAQWATLWALMDKKVIPKWCPKLDDQKVFAKAAEFHASDAFNAGNPKAQAYGRPTYIVTEIDEEGNPIAPPASANDLGETAQESDTRNADEKAAKVKVKKAKDGPAAKKPSKGKKVEADSTEPVAGKTEDSGEQVNASEPELLVTNA